MNRPLVIYHGNCADGFSAAWCFWRRAPDGRILISIEGYNQWAEAPAAACAPRAHPPPAHRQEDVAVADNVIQLCA